MGSTQSKIPQFSVPLQNSQQKGFSQVYRNYKFKNSLTETPSQQLRTYRDVIIQSCKKTFTNKPLAGKIHITKQMEDGKEVQHRTIQQYTYGECFNLSQNLGKAIIGRKLEYKEPQFGMRFIGIYAKNRVEWLLVDLACSLFGLTSIPLYDTLGLQNLIYCLKQTEMTSLFITAQTFKVLLKLQNYGNLKNLILFDQITEQMVQQAKKHNFHLFNINWLIEDGKNYNINYQNFKVQQRDCLTFSYTSGTTGPPKGAMLSHGNFMAFLSCFMNHPSHFVESDVYLSFLPLPHVMERCVFTALIYCGCYIVFYSGDMLKIKDDCQAARPTIFVGVPRIYNRIVEKVTDTFNTTQGIKKCLIDNAVSSKQKQMDQTGSFTNCFYDSIVFSKTKDQFGGRIRLMITGSAPISKSTQKFMQMILCAPMYQGYGQTQNTGAAFVTYPGETQFGIVGGIVSSLQFKLSDIPQMKYTANDKDENGKSTPRGQIWLRGPSVFMGYYKLKDKTEQALTKDGWLKTGDVGMLTPDRLAMKIIDRKKNIFKLQQGQYIAPQKVQSVYLKSHLIDEAFLHGESNQNFTIVIAKPNKQHFLEFAKKNNISGAYEELCHNREIKILILKQLNAFAKSSGLNSLEQAKNIYLEVKPFQQVGILTNTMKLQRFQAKVHYKSVIGQIYSQGELPIK